MMRGVSLGKGLVGSVGYCKKGLLPGGGAKPPWKAPLPKESLELQGLCCVRPVSKAFGSHDLLDGQT